MNLDLTLTPGKAFGFLGSNGAGKTTTIKMLARLIRSTGGECSLLGQPSWRLTPRHWQVIGYVSENQRLYEGLTGRALVEFTARLYPEWDRAYERELTRQLDLPLDRGVRQYSHGEKIKLSLLSVVQDESGVRFVHQRFTADVGNALIRQQGENNVSLEPLIPGIPSSGHGATD